MYKANKEINEVAYVKTNREKENMWQGMVFYYKYMSSQINKM